MTNKITLRSGLLAATSAAALMFAATSAQATSIGFAPGASNGGGNTNAFSGVDLDTSNNVTFFNWTSVNRGITNGTGTAAAVTATGVGTPTTRARSWFLNINDNGTAGATTDDTFDEFFSFSLVSSEDDVVLGTDTYGSDFASHVFMEFTGSGNITQISGDTTYDNDVTFGLNYTSADFVMIFDADGDFTSSGDKVTIATFSGTGGTTSAFDGALRANLSWTADWDQAFTGVFDIAFGGAEASDGIAGLTGMRTGLNAFKITDQDVDRVLVGAQGNFDVSYLLTSDGSATGRSEFAVPEPGTLALFGVGLIGLGAIARRRRAAA